MGFDMSRRQQQRLAAMEMRRAQQNQLNNQRRPRAIAVPLISFRAIPFPSDDQLFMMFHALLALLIPFLIFALVGCTSDYNGEPVDYGPEVPIANVINALKLPSKDIDPTKMKEGAFVHFQTVQVIGANEIYSVIADTGQTIKKREETDAQVTFSLEEEKYSYKQGQKPDHLVRDFNLIFDKPTKSPVGSTEVPVDPSASASALSSALAPLVAGSKAASGLVSGEVSGGPVVNAQEVKVTYHNLRTSLSQVAPPAGVASKAGCLGLPQCLMTLHNVSFDQVAWNPSGPPDRIHFEFAVSPHVPQHAGFNMSALFPYYPGLFKSCVTLMVSIGDGHSKTLLNECQEVVDFLFETAK
jgi:hypothetical protein